MSGAHQEWTVAEYRRLRSMLRDEQLKVAQAAERLGRSYFSVYSALQRHGDSADALRIEGRRAGAAPAWLLDAWDEIAAGAAVAEVCERYGKSRGGMRNWFSRHGLSIREARAAAKAWQGEQIFTRWRDGETMEDLAAEFGLSLRSARARAHAHHGASLVAFRRALSVDEERIAYGRRMSGAIWRELAAEFGVSASTMFDACRRYRDRLDEEAAA